MTEYCTYIHYDPKSGLARYVGFGSLKRPYEHLKKSHNRQFNFLIQKRLNEGYTFTPDIYPAPSKESAIAMEIFWIATIGREDLGTGSLFNRTPGGEKPTSLGRVQSLEERQARSKQKTEFFADPKNKEAHVEACKRAGPKLSSAGKSYYAKPGSKDFMLRPCTVDGVTIYPSVRALIAALGQGKTGYGSPSFSYVNPTHQRRVIQSSQKPCTVDGITIYPSVSALKAALGNGKNGIYSPTFRYLIRNSIKEN